MEPFARKGVGDIYLRSLTKPLFRPLMRMQGVQDMTKVSNDELDAYVDLLRRGDLGVAFLKIMRGFERTRTKRDRYVGALRHDGYHAQVIWGAHPDPRGARRSGSPGRRVEAIHRLPGKHILQEDQAPAIAALIAAIAG
ncbi:MAG: hypothetical protein M3Y33_02585 [Actinomycetota bacterium]|nr:hypothetical protein [Actinomycetota bacterium]